MILKTLGLMAEFRLAGTSGVTWLKAGLTLKLDDIAEGHTSSRSEYLPG